MEALIKAGIAPTGSSKVVHLQSASVSAGLPASSGEKRIAAFACVTARGASEVT